MLSSHVSRDLGMQLKNAQRKIFGKGKLKESGLQWPLNASSVTTVASVELKDCRNGKRMRAIKMKG